jgi:NADH:ubiquinone oxidoreductase subunit E
MSGRGAETGRVTITICMGSSCFSRGNKKSLQMIKEYVAAKNLEADLVFMGSHCMDLCDRGPLLKVNNKVFQMVDPHSVTDLLDEALYH